MLHSKRNRTLRTFFHISVSLLTGSLCCSETPQTHWLSEHYSAIFLLCQVPLKNNSLPKNFQELKVASGVLTLACVPEVPGFLLLVLSNTSLQSCWITKLKLNTSDVTYCADICMLCPNQTPKNRKWLCSSYNNLISSKQQGTISWFQISRCIVKAVSLTRRVNKFNIFLWAQSTTSAYMLRVSFIK